MKKWKHNRHGLLSVVGLVGGLVFSGVAGADEVQGEMGVDSEGTQDLGPQDKGEDKKECGHCGMEKMGGIYAVGGVGFFGFKGLDDQLVSNGYEKLDGPFIPIGIAADFRIWRFVMGAEYHRLRNFETSARSDDLRADVDGSYWLYRIGFDVVKWHGLHIYPLFGIGAGRITLRIDEEQGASFADVLVNPRRQSTISQRALLLDGSLAVDYRFAMMKRKHKTAYFTVGLRGGYTVAPFSGDWHNRSAEISGGPKLGLSGPTFALLLGVSWKREGPKSRHNGN